MILPFSTHFPNGKPTYFAHKIINSLVRESAVYKNEKQYMAFIIVTAARLIKLATKSAINKVELIDECNITLKIHSLRLDKKNRWKVGNKIHFYLWNRTKRAWCFAVSECIGIEYAIIEPHLKQVRVASIDELGIVNRLLSPKELDQFIKNDGFDCEEDFWAFFTESETYKIIHWTNYRYV